MDVVITIVISTGLFFFFGAAVGLVRFPDFYTRMHAAGIGDTFAALLVLGGLALEHLRDVSVSHILVACKILGILVFIFLTSPTSTHALIRAGYEGEEGSLPWKKPTDDEPEMPR